MPTLCPKAVERRAFVMPGLTVTVGKYWARAARMVARASRTPAAAAAMFWFEILSLSSKAFNCGSLSGSHHLPRDAASFGCAGSQSPSRFDAPVSLYAGGTGAVGAMYFGPTLHADSSRANAAIM